MKNLINAFYSAFQNLDAEKMVKCYHSNVEFSDPAFGRLHGERAMNMWRMLCANAKDLEIVYSEVVADEKLGTVHWEARYVFRQTGKKVHNVIEAKFTFKDGKIIKHVDDFSMFKWSKQALGLPGLLLGWSPIIKNKVQKKTNQLLDEFEKGR